MTSVGADAGFAAIVGLAILILLYFAQAREAASLRSRAQELLERVGELEARLARLAAAPPRPAPREPDAVPARAEVAEAPPVKHPSPPPARSVRFPHLSPAGAANGSAPLLCAPPGVAGPALSSATRSVGGAVVQPAPRVPVAVAAVPEAAAVPEVAAVPLAAVMPRATVAAAAVGAPLATRAPAGARQEPARVAASGAAAPPPAAARPAPVGRPGSAAARRRVPSRRLPAESDHDGTGGAGSRFGRAGVVAVAAVAVAVVVVAYLLLFDNSPSSGPASSAPAAGTPATTTAPANQGTTNQGTTTTTSVATVVNPSSVTVVVLNGTAINGLARKTSQGLAARGFRQGAIASGTDQTLKSTIVSYVQGARDQALAVAHSLGLGSGSVAPIDSSTRAVACGGAATCAATVVVTAGADLVGR